MYLSNIFTRRFYSSLLVLSACLLLNACQQSSSAPEQSNTATVAAQTPVKLVEVKPKEQQVEQKLRWYQGTIQLFAMEGGFYGIVTEQGEHILPMNLAKEFRIPGAVVKFNGQFKKNMLTIQQWGKPFVVEQMILIKRPEVVDDHTM